LTADVLYCWTIITITRRDESTTAVQCRRSHRFNALLILFCSAIFYTFFFFF
jgi:hypothetical protein